MKAFSPLMWLKDSDGIVWGDEKQNAFDQTN